MLKDSFRKYLTEAIGSDNALVAFSAFDTPASVSVRLNPFKPSALMEGLKGSQVEWSPYGFLLQERPVFTLDPLFHAGAYYVQDSSSMFVAHVLRQYLQDFPSGRPLKVLDLCAAPGGKTTDAAASLRESRGDAFLLVANEVMKQRCSVLSTNVALWGDPNIVVTNDDPRAFAALEGFFDIIIADVPCSGEGMFRKDAQAVEQWSEDNVQMCAARQKRIVADVWNSLAEGGIFIYSTCTFNRYENDLNASWIVNELGAEVLTSGVKDKATGVINTGSGYSLVPGHVPGEGQYCAAFRKISAGSRTQDKYGSYSYSRPSRTPLKKDPAMATLENLFTCKMSFRQKGQTYIAVPIELEGLVAQVESYLHVVSEGCAAGVLKGRDFVPDADLALCIKLSPNAYESVSVDRDTALSFLKKEAILLPDAPRGIVLLEYGSVPLGFVKNIGNRCNNLHPSARRIRMEI